MLQPTLYDNNNDDDEDDIEDDGNVYQQLQTYCCTEHVCDTQKI